MSYKLFARRRTESSGHGLDLLEPGSLSVLPLIIGYALCSSLLAVINKYAIVVFPHPSILTCFQYATSCLLVLLLGRLRILHHDPVTVRNLVKFLPAALVFYLAILTNTFLLKYANVDTFIVFRSSTPILVAICDFYFRRQPWPGLRTLFSLLVILAGAVGYVLTDSKFTVHAYTWALLYLLTITIEMVYIKHIVSSFGMNTWGLVLYNNLLSLLLAPIFIVITGEQKVVLEIATSAMHFYASFGIVFPVAVSCVFGLAISFFGFACRKAISATAFTVVGVTNKLLSVIINVFMWEKHASPFGVCCLLVTIMGGVLYQQASSSGHPKPATPPEEDKNSEV